MSDVNDFTLEKIVTFLKDYSWIYNFKVTNLLSDNIIDTVPQQWKLFLTSLDIETFNKVFMEQQHHNNNIPDSILKHYIVKCIICLKVKLGIWRLNTPL